MNAPPLPIRKRFPWIVYWIFLVLIVLLALAPVGSVVACGIIANAHGCRVDEGSVHPCIIVGHDYGQLLYALGVLSWLMLVTLPSWPVHICRLVDRSHRSSCRLAKTIHCRLAADPPAAIICVSAIAVLVHGLPEIAFE